MDDLRPNLLEMIGGFGKKIVEQLFHGRPYSRAPKKGGGSRTMP